MAQRKTTMQKILKSFRALVFCVRTVYPDLVASPARAEEEPAPGFYGCAEKAQNTAATLECLTRAYTNWDKALNANSRRRRAPGRTRGMERNAAPSCSKHRACGYSKWRRWPTPFSGGAEPWTSKPSATLVLGRRRRKPNCCTLANITSSGTKHRHVSVAFFQLRTPRRPVDILRTMEYPIRSG